MWLEDHFGNGSVLQRNERVKLAASFWNNVGAAMVIGGIAAAFFLDKPQGTWTKLGIAIAGLALGWLCYSIASNILTSAASSANGSAGQALASPGPLRSIQRCGKRCTRSGWPADPLPRAACS
jgi:hypothetical protein